MTAMSRPIVARRRRSRTAESACCRARWRRCAEGAGVRAGQILIAARGLGERGAGREGSEAGEGGEEKGEAHQNTAVSVEPSAHHGAARAVVADEVGRVVLEVTRSGSIDTCPCTSSESEPVSTSPAC